VLSGLTVGMGASWNLHFVYSKNVLVYNCTIVSKSVNNGDGFDPDSSENCVIFGCLFDTGDDCVAIKSGKNPEGNVINRACKNIYIFDCISLGGHGMSIGSEMSGGVENVFIWDCDFDNTWYGIQIKGTRKRGGYVKNVHVKDCRTTAIIIWSVGYNDDGEGSLTPPVFSDYSFENIVVTGTDYFKNANIENYRRFIFLRGFEEEEYHIQNVTFNNITFVNLGDLQPLEKEYVGEIVWEKIFW
jgi:polygalacturonase